MIHPSYITLRVAQEQIAQRRGTAERRRGVRRALPPVSTPVPARYDSVAVRAARPADREAIRRLAVLDDKPMPMGEVLVAEADGEVIAALGNLGPTIAHPFRKTRDVVTLLEMRSVQLRARYA